MSTIMMLATIVLVTSGGRTFRVVNDEPACRASLAKVSVVRSNWVTDRSPRDLPACLGADESGIILGFTCEHPEFQYATSFGDIELEARTGASEHSVRIIEGERMRDLKPENRRSADSKNVLGLTFRIANLPMDVKTLRLKGGFHVVCKKFDPILVKAFAAGRGHEGDRWVLESNDRRIELSRENCTLTVIVSDAKEIGEIDLVDEDGNAAERFRSYQRVKIGARAYFAINVGCYEIDHYDLRLKSSVKEEIVPVVIVEDHITLPH